MLHTDLWSIPAGLLAHTPLTLSIADVEVIDAALELRDGFWVRCVSYCIWFIFIIFVDLILYIWGYKWDVMLLFGGWFGEPGMLLGFTLRACGVSRIVGPGIRNRVVTEMVSELRLQTLGSAGRLVSRVRVKWSSWLYVISRFTQMNWGDI